MFSKEFVEMFVNDNKIDGHSEVISKLFLESFARTLLDCVKCTSKEDDIKVSVSSLGHFLVKNNRRYGKVLRYKSNKKVKEIMEKA